MKEVKEVKECPICKNNRNLGRIESLKLIEETNEFKLLYYVYNCRSCGWHSEKYTK